MKLRMLILTICVTGCTSPAYLVRQSSEPKEGEIELISPDGATFNDSNPRAEAIMDDFCSPQQPMIVSRQTKLVENYSAMREDMMLHKRQYVTFQCMGADSSSSRMPASTSEKK